jgi:hypothetical protein
MTLLTFTVCVSASKNWVARSLLSTYAVSSGVRSRLPGRGRVPPIGGVSDMFSSGFEKWGEASSYVCACACAAGATCLRLPLRCLLLD